MADMGVKSFRLSPHTHDMKHVACLFRNVLDKKIEADEAEARLKELIPNAPFSNGFYHKTLGFAWKAA
jgi:collagenase-like PrtC family protease